MKYATSRYACAVEKVWGYDFKPPKRSAKRNVLEDMPLECRELMALVD